MAVDPARLSFRLSPIWNHVELHHSEMEKIHSVMVRTSEYQCLQQATANPSAGLELLNSGRGEN